mmetsp:Transcript_32110/g.69356  ORF Transcript_32110/g.69356 Transcript_32110/m.69356 type:complete len:81 (-) Transcript_32110:757-999(-)
MRKCHEDDELVLHPFIDTPTLLRVTPPSAHSTLRSLRVWVSLSHCQRFSSYLAQVLDELGRSIASHSFSWFAFLTETSAT